LSAELADSSCLWSVLPDLSITCTSGPISPSNSTRRDYLTVERHVYGWPFATAFTIYIDLADVPTPTIQKKTSP